ncbi:serine/threonine-protein kinase [Botrimarina mediterranea]|uniref:Serine/threonine-protein kinase PknA n=1 Tax=Botrimarina mediterranea TaxID=2528022 RepID=A0A518K9T0_9BACT|nr:serine/threonine-protein kinase [Botrimarina mediterranea]QDV74541.1 Serine/threonine-protein kinase PknA [Botrimarina mediterranea]QDV79181.1 Serine/threonine-protein kinase PknA [Planctomycetes bacterium K2D]
MSDTQEPDSLEYLLAFERAVQADPLPDVGGWVERWPDPKSRCDVASSLLLCAVEHLGFDIAWLKTQQGDPRFPSTVWASGELLRMVYRDQVDSRGRPRWGDYESFGVPADQLGLRADKDRYSLGQVVAGRYQLTRRLGGGGVGVVYEACDTAESRNVAVKVPLEVEDDERFSEAIRKEAAVLASLSHPGVPRFVDLLEAERGPVLVTELVTGDSLEDRGRLSFEEALPLVIQVAEVLDDLHQAGYVHGDVKPDNILVDGSEKATLIDFNVSRIDNPTTATEGFPGGTLPFMSPEAVVGVAADVDLRQDVYALGSLLYQLVVGEPLMRPKGREEAVVMSVLLGGSHEPKFADDIPESVRRLCQAAISRHPLSRFETASDFAATCSQVLSNPTAEHDIPPARTELHSWRLGVALGTLAVRQRRITTTLGESDDLAVLQDLLPNIIGVTTAMDEVVPLAERLCVPVTEWEGADECRTLFYRQRRLQTDDLLRLKALAPEAEQWTRDTLKTVETGLTDSLPQGAALYFAALQSRFVPYASSAAERWPGVAIPVGFPEKVTGAFLLACASPGEATDWGRSLQQLDYAVVRWLRWGVVPC